jgi:hypothetical protein
MTQTEYYDDRMKDLKDRMLNLRVKFFDRVMQIAEEFGSEADLLSNQFKELKTRRNQTVADEAKKKYEPTKEELEKEVQEAIAEAEEVRKTETK